MTAFCRNFCFKCEQCREAIKELEQEEKILEEIEGPLYSRTEEEQAGLDCHGQP